MQRFKWQVQHFIRIVSLEVIVHVAGAMKG